MAEDAAKPANVRTITLLELGRGLLSSPLALPVILLLTFAVFAPSLNDWFRADDFWLLRSSERTPLGTYIVEAFDYRDPDPVPAFAFYRPLYVITFKLCYEAFGMHAVAYHLLNVGLHLVAVVLVWFLARRIIAQPILATLATLLFALHPAYTETVTWIARGNTLMLTVAYLSTFLLFLKYLDRGRYAPGWYAASLATFAVALMYHPNALSLLPLLPAYYFLIARRPSEEFLRVRAWLPFVPFLAVGLFWSFIQNHVRNEYGLGDTFTVGWHQYSNYGQYIGLSLFPVLPSEWAKADLSADLRTNLQGLASVVMIGLMLLLLARRRWPYLGVFAVWWFLTALFFNTTIILARAVPAQLYLPGFSVAFLFVIGWLWLVEFLDEEAPKVLDVGRKVMPLAIAILVVAVVVLDLVHLREDQTFGSQNERFIAALRADVPALEPGTRLFIVAAPFNLHVFTDHALDAAVELYYGDVEVHNVPAQALPELEPLLQPGDVVYKYNPGK